MQITIFQWWLQDKDGEEYLYAIGGWNMYYLKSVHRIKMSATGAGDAAGWQEFPSMQAERADHACAEVQVDSGRKGIVASGGYRNDGAWLSSVEFLDYETGNNIFTTDDTVWFVYIIS